MNIASFMDSLYKLYHIERFHIHSNENDHKNNHGNARAVVESTKTPKNAYFIELFNMENAY